MQKLLVNWYLLHFYLELRGLILFSDKHNFLLKKYKIYTQTIHASNLASKSTFHFLFFKFLDPLKLHNLNLKLSKKEYNKTDLLHLSVVPQQSGG